MSTIRIGLNTSSQLTLFATQTIELGENVIDFPTTAKVQFGIETYAVFKPVVLDRFGENEWNLIAKHRIITPALGAAIGAFLVS